MDLKGRRQSENVHKQIVPMLSRFDWLDPLMAAQASVPALANAILRPSLGPKPAVSKAMEDANYRDRLHEWSVRRQRAMPEPSFGADEFRHREIEVRAAAIVAEQAHADLLRQTAPKPRGRGSRR